MKDAIDILKQEYDWVCNNRDACPFPDEYYCAYREGIKNCIDLLKMAEQAGPEDIPKVQTESVKSPKIAFCEACGTALGIK